MSEDRKPLAGAVRAAEFLSTAEDKANRTGGLWVDQVSIIIERESGLRELVEAAEALLAIPTKGPRSDRECQARKALAAILKRVREP